MSPSSDVEPGDIVRPTCLSACLHEHESMPARESCEEAI